VKQGEPILEIHHRNGRGLADARRLLDASIEIGDAPAAGRPLVLERIERRSA
jgi:thymidine phosphorylase